MVRRSFLLAAGSAAFLRGVVPDYEKPVCDLPKWSKSPVRVRSLELLKNGKTYFVRATSDDGAVGIGLVKQIEDYLPMLTRVAMPFFTGKDVRDLESLIDQFYVAHYKYAGQALWAPAAYVEQAMLDLYGKTVNQPIGALLGGVIRKKIPVYLSGSGRETTAEQEVEVYREALALSGARAMKFKIGGRMSRNADAYPGRTEKMMALARKTYGDNILIYADANGSYDSEKAIEVGRMLQDLRCGFYEEPCPWEEISETRRVADALQIPIAFGEQDSSLWKFQHMIATRAIDIVQPDLNYNGGFIRAARVARMARAVKMPITPHNTQTGASSCNIIQFASAIPNIGPYMEYPFRGKVQNEPWFAPHFVIRDGAIDVPPGPGLGIEIDPKFLAAARPVTA
jgi:L-alanine-DL-glutamate epimerase-like enolase superfamily enzyme